MRSGGGLPKPVLRREYRHGVVDAASAAGVEISLGPSAETLRDVAAPRRWLGLAYRDRRLLELFVGGLGVVPDELHTHVPVGTQRVLPGLPLGDEAQRIVQGCWPRRIDAVMRFGVEWWLVECKPDANHYCLGQVLCYVFWWQRDCPGRDLSQVLVVTDVCDRDVLPVFDACGVSVVEVGDGRGVGAPGG